MFQDGLMIGNAPDFTLSLQGEVIFHRVTMVIWRKGLQEPSESPSERGLSVLRNRVLEIVRAKTNYGKLVSGANDFGICEVPEKSIKITVNIMWNQRLSPKSIDGIRGYYRQTFFGTDDSTIKVSDNDSEGGPKSN